MQSCPRTKRGSDSQGHHEVPELSVSPPSSPSIVRSLEKYLSQPIDPVATLLQVSRKVFPGRHTRQKKPRCDTTTNSFISSTPEKKSPKSHTTPIPKTRAKKIPVDTIFSPVFHPIPTAQLGDQPSHTSAAAGAVSVPHCPCPPVEMLEAPTYIACHEYVQGINTQDESFLDMALFLHCLPPPQLPVSPALPQAAPSNKMTLVLDLDETLVHCSTNAMPNSTFTFPVTFNEQDFTVYVRLRPHLHTFLQAVSRCFEVVLFTASHQIYADTLVSILDPEGIFLKYRLFRDNCICVNGNYIKDLGILGRPLSRTLIVDNSPHAFAYHTANAVPIVSWFDNVHDTELVKLASFLVGIAERNPSDLRPFLRSIFALPERVFA